VLILQTGPVAERVRVREIDDDEGRRLVRIVRRDSGSVVTWRPARCIPGTGAGGHLYAIAGREVIPEPGEPEVIFCVEEFGPLGLQPRARAAVGRGQRQEQGARPQATAPDARHLPAHRRGPAAVRRPRAG
jgi:hypothetical protein